jgi:AraC-like DNA-binding protein
MQFDLKDFTKYLEVTRIANAHYFEFSNNYRVIPNRHEFCELVYVDSGRIDLNAENYTGELTAGMMVIHKPNERHALSCGSDAAPNVIVIGFECNCGRLDYFSNHALTLNIYFQRMLAEIIKECRNMFLPPYDIPYTVDMKKREDSVFGCDQMVKNLLEQFLIKLIRFVEHVEKDGGDRFSDIRTAEISVYLKENFRQTISVRQLCVLFGTNRTTLSASFKRQTGKSIIEYVNGLKIAEAKRLMRIREKSFAQIADELGFDSAHYFTRLFRKLEKKSPSQYMRMIKSKFEGDQ